jgi:hypothetical protein
MTPNGRLYFHSKDPGYRSDFSKASLGNKAIFVHEMMHVYQFQHGMSTLRIAYEKLTHGGYDYLPVGGQTQFEKYGIEQQAMIVEDRFLLRNGVRLNDPAQPSRSWYDNTIPFGH